MRKLVWLFLLVLLTILILPANLAFACTPPPGVDPLSGPYCVTDPIALTLWYMGLASVDFRLITPLCLMAFVVVLVYSVLMLVHKKPDIVSKEQK